MFEKIIGGVMLALGIVLSWIGHITGLFLLIVPVALPLIVFGILLLVLKKKNNWLKVGSIILALSPFVVVIVGYIGQLFIEPSFGSWDFAVPFVYGYFVSVVLGVVGSAAMIVGLVRKSR
jgi:hypothetical protein